MFRVHDLQQLTSEHPAQWIANTDDGRRIFVHAKWGRLRVWAGPSHVSDHDLRRTDPAIDMEFAHEHDACPLWNEVEALTGIEWEDTSSAT